MTVPRPFVPVIEMRRQKGTGTKFGLQVQQLKKFRYSLLAVNTGGELLASASTPASHNPGECCMIMARKYFTFLRT